MECNWNNCVGGNEKNKLSGSTPNVCSFTKIFFINHELIESKRAFESCLINFYSVVESLVEKQGKSVFQKNFPHQTVEWIVVSRCEVHLSFLSLSFVSKRMQNKEEGK